MDLYIADHEYLPLSNAVSTAKDDLDKHIRALGNLAPDQHCYDKFFGKLTDALAQLEELNLHILEC